MTDDEFLTHLRRTGDQPIPLWTPPAYPSGHVSGCAVWSPEPVGCDCGSEDSDLSTAARLDRIAPVPVDLDEAAS